MSDLEKLKQKIREYQDSRSRRYKSDFKECYDDGFNDALSLFDDALETLSLIDLQDKQINENKHYWSFFMRDNARQALADLEKKVSK